MPENDNETMIDDEEEIVIHTHIPSLEEKEETEDTDASPKKYRTSQTATGLTPVQQTTALPSIVPYLNAISFRPNIKSPDFPNDPLSHMICLKEAIGLEFDDTRIEGCINTDKYRLKPKNIVDPKDIDLELLTILYSVIVNEFDLELAKGRVILPNKRTIAKIYVPDLLKQMGYEGNINQNKINQLLEKLKILDRVYGYVNIRDNHGVHEELARVFIFEGYSPQENAFTFGSRYFELIAYHIQLARIRKVEDNTGKRLLDENGNLIRDEKDQVWLTPGHTRLLKTSAYQATKREFAWELASILCSLIDRTGSTKGSVPHITARKLIYGCRHFLKTLENTKQEKHQNQKLKRTFEAVQDILVNHSYLKETYKDIELNIPVITMKNMDTVVIKFPHKGRIKKNENEESAT